MTLGPWLRVALLSWAVSACASHSDKIKAMRTALDAGQPEQALAAVNEHLDVKSDKELPKSANGDAALFLLDRSMILQSILRYEYSSRDLELADKQVELLDFSRNAAHDIGKYMFSDDVGPYKAPAYEKLLVNTANMMNYLARSDLQGARIEARRLAVMQKYLNEHEEISRTLLGPGAYLAGFTYEKSGKVDEALRYYDEALSAASYPSLAEPVKRLLARGSFDSPRLRAIAAKAPAEAPPAAATPAEAAPAEAAPAEATSVEDGEILVVIGYGRVPEKIAKRVPIGLALTFASGWISPHDASRANQLAAQGLVTWVNFPDLSEVRPRYDTPIFGLDGHPRQLESVIAIDEEARRAWEQAKGPVMAAAITRMIVRAVAGQGARAATKDDGLGTLLSLGIQATMTAADTPDTRSWETLPARLVFGRVRVQPGTHDIELSVRGIKKRQRISISPGGYAFVVHTVLR